MLKRPSQNRRRGHISARQAMVATMIAVAVLLATPSVPLARAKVSQEAVAAAAAIHRPSQY